MAHDIYIPKMGANIDRVEIGKLKVQTGDHVKKGDVLFEMVTDKATFEVTAEEEGTILDLACREGDDLAVFSVVGYIGKKGEAIPKKMSIPTEPTPAAPAPVSGSTVKITPKAAALARDLGVDISKQKFTSRVVREKDILEMASDGARPMALIYGFSGHGTVVCDILLSARVPCKGFIDDDPSKKGMQYRGVSVIGDRKAISDHTDCMLVLAIGDNPTRRRLFEELATEGAQFMNAVHPSAIISDTVQIGKGVVIAAGTVINANAVIKDDVIINTGATVDHDCAIHAHAHVAPGAHLGGSVTIGEGTLVGIGVSINRGITVGKESIIVSGVALYRDTPDNVLVRSEQNQTVKSRG